MKVGSTPDLMVAYIDFFLSGDEKRLNVASTILQRFPMCIIFGGDGSYMSPYYLHSDMLTNLLGEVRGQIKLLDGGSICFGLSDYLVSEFELVAEELLISDSIIKVYGAFRMYVKMLLMWDSKKQIDDEGNRDVGASMLEAGNLVILRQNSVIPSNGDLSVYGQGLLKLYGLGDVIKAQWLSLSLFYNIKVWIIFSKECPVGTFKDVGSDPSLCSPCSIDLLPQRVDFIYVGGWVTEPFCPYKCLSDKYKMPKGYTPLEELIYTFGGSWPFAIVLSFILVLLALLLSALRIKMVGSDFQYQTSNPIRNDGSASFLCLLSLAEVPWTSRAEETQSHVHRLHFVGLIHSENLCFFHTLPQKQLLELCMKMLLAALLMRSTLLLHTSGGKDLYKVFFQCLHTLVPGLGSNGTEERKFIVFKNMLRV